MIPSFHRVTTTASIFYDQFVDPPRNCGELQGASVPVFIQSGAENVPVPWLQFSCRPLEFGGHPGREY